MPAFSYNRAVATHNSGVASFFFENQLVLTGAASGAAVVVASEVVQLTNFVVPALSESPTLAGTASTATPILCAVLGSRLLSSPMPGATIDRA